MKANIEYSKSIRMDPAKKREADNTIQEYSEADRVSAKYTTGNYEPYRLTNEEESEVNAMIVKAEESLKIMGIEDAEELLPSIADIDFIKHPHDASGVEHTASLEIVIPREKSMSDPVMQYFFFHELSHFITEKFYKEDRKGTQMLSWLCLENTQRGYDNLDRDRKWRGI